MWCEAEAVVLSCYDNGLSMAEQTQVHSVMAGLMDRLARYASADKAVMDRLNGMQAFERFREAIAAVIAAQVCGCFSCLIVVSPKHSALFVDDCQAASTPNL
jgi:hypothetical protein